MGAHQHRIKDLIQIDRPLTSTRNMGGTVITAFKTASPIPINPALSGIKGFITGVE